jgi:hypothetical protein
MKKIIIPIIIVLVIAIAGGAFYGGMKYGQNKISSQRSSFQNLSPEQRQQFAQGAGRAGANFLSGEVISKDEKSLTIKLPDGSTKIIFFSDSTQISKTTEGSIGDIEIGKQIMVSGDQNSDGSYTAKTIQLSPSRPTSQK